MTNRTQLRDRIHDLEDETRHKDRIHKALLDGYDAITAQHDGAKLAAEMIAADADLLHYKLAQVRGYAEQLLGSGSSAYRKAGTQILDILDGHEDQQQEAAS